MNKVTASDITDEHRPVPKPCVKFEHAFHPYPEILREIEKQNFKEPSPIQAQVWPLALQGFDVIGIAQTGTGKTLAFLLPAFIHVDSQPTPRRERSGPSCLILSPTRELALQIESEVRKFHYRGIKSVCIYGGGSRKNQINDCVDGVDIIIATPGRLNDLVQANIIKVDSISFLVLDEADRMLDMGFEPQIMKILLDIRPDRHTIMTSATWPDEVRQLALRYARKPFIVFVNTLDLTAVHSVSQKIMVVTDEEKKQRLKELLLSLERDAKIIIFVAQKILADHLSSDLNIEGIDCQSMHGDRDQAEREQALKDIKSGQSRILVATDLAARGLDIVDITHVLNYDFPRNIEEYVHRVGRTGRAGRTGTSITFMTYGDRRHAADLIKIMKEANQPIPYELERWAERNRQRGESNFRGNFKQNRYNNPSNGYSAIDPFAGFQKRENARAGHSHY